MEGADELRLGDGPVGALLIHGYTGTPAAMRDLAHYLAERHLRITTLRLPGHGTSWEDLALYTAEDWAAAVEDAFDELRATAQQVFVVGLSFGAALALDLAARRRQEVAGVVTLAGMVASDDRRRFMAPLIRLFLRSLPGVGSDIADPERRETAYERLPVASTHSMLRFLRRARRSLPLVRCPIVVMHGLGDHVVSPVNASTIFEGVGSEDKELVWLQRSWHVVTLDYDRLEVFERTYLFIKEHAHHAV